MKFEDVEKARETYRGHLVKRLSITFSIIAVILVLMVFGVLKSSFTIFSAFSILPMMLFFGIFGLIIATLTLREERRAYHKAYKGFFVQTSLNNIFTQLTYKRDGGISSQFLRGTGMVNTGDRYSANDYVQGKYKDVAFAQSDVSIEERHTDSDGNTTYSTIFKGRFMIFEFPKKFAYQLEVVEKGFGACLIPRGSSRVKLESSEFNNMFMTYAQDEFEAFYILGPDLMNNLLELGEKYTGRIMLCFLNNQLVVGLSDGKDAFEPPSVFKPIDKEAEAAKVTKEISIITDFVDQLKLNRKLFK